MQSLSPTSKSLPLMEDSDPGQIRKGIEDDEEILRRMEAKLVKMMVRKGDDFMSDGSLDLSHPEQRKEDSR